LIAAGAEGYGPEARSSGEGLSVLAASDAGAGAKPETSG